MRYWTEDGFLIRPPELLPSISRGANEVETCPCASLVFAATPPRYPGSELTQRPLLIPLGWGCDQRPRLFRLNIKILEVILELILGHWLQWTKGTNVQHVSTEELRHRFSWAGNHARKQHSSVTILSERCWCWCMQTLYIVMDLIWSRIGSGIRKFLYMSENISVCKVPLCRIQWICLHMVNVLLCAAAFRWHFMKCLDDIYERIWEFLSIVSELWMLSRLAVCCIVRSCGHSFTRPWYWRYKYSTDNQNIHNHSDGGGEQLGTAVSRVLTKWCLRGQSCLEWR